MSNLKLLLHTCCATCVSWLADILSLSYDVDLYYYNPNIHPEKEYQRRLGDIQKVAEILNLKLIEGEYNSKAWLDHVRGYEKEKEGGTRCPICFEFRLRETARYAKDHGYDAFMTTISMGRNKKAEVITPIGEEIAKEFGLDYESRDFKKGGGLDESYCRSEEYGVVRQHYCGCPYSLRDAAYTCPKKTFTLESISEDEK